MWLFTVILFWADEIGGWQKTWEDENLALQFNFYPWSLKALPHTLWQLSLKSLINWIRQRDRSILMFWDSSYNTKVMCFLRVETIHWSKSLDWESLFLRKQSIGQDFLKTWNVYICYSDIIIKIDSFNFLHEFELFSL